MDGAQPHIARPVPGLLPLDDARGALRVLVASLAPGGAERIVLEWLEAEGARGREIELAVLHGRQHALLPPASIRVRVRGGQSPETFLDELARSWQGGPPASTHLIPDDCLARLWQGGVRTVPTVHNAKAGWRNDPASWVREHVPMAVACAQSVHDEMRQAGCRVPIVTIRHRPSVSADACDTGLRKKVREELAIPQLAFVMVSVGALKAQKDHARAVEVLAEVARHRDAYLVILGGILEPRGFGALDAVIDAALAHGVSDRLRLPGWVASIAPFLAASDALVNTSRFEGLSIASQEALAAGLPVIATDVGGQAEILHDALQLLPPDTGVREFATRLEAMPVRTTLTAQAFERAPRAGSLALTAHAAAGEPIDTLFVTANLNAGGAQRSLVNLAVTLARHAILSTPAQRFEIAVCGESSHAAFATLLRGHAVACFRASAERDDYAIAESLLAHASRRGARVLCFWNVAPGVKLLAAKFAPPGLALVDVSPGAHAFEELESCGPLTRSHDFSVAAYYRRLDALVLKHHAASHPACRRVVVIANGVAMRSLPMVDPAGAPRFLVNGRIAPSKRLEIIVEALRVVAHVHPGAELHVVGPAEERHAQYAGVIADQARGLPVRFRGPDFALDCLGEPWTAAIVLGTHQGCPNAVLEAMAAGIPVIANESGGTGELVRDGHTGWLLPPEPSPAAVASAMREAIDDPVQARVRALRGRDHVANSHSLDDMARAYASLLEEAGGREKMPVWNSASVPAVPLP